MAKKKKKERSPDWGGKRQGAGRPAELEDLVLTTIRFEQVQLDALEKYAEAEDVSGLAAAVRRLIDTKLLKRKPQ